jgi:hypothetical protein
MAGNRKEVVVMNGSTHEGEFLAALLRGCIDDVREHTAGSRLVSRRWNRATFREIYVIQDRFVLKRFVFNGCWAWARKPWRNEHKVLMSLEERVAPQSFGYIETASRDGRRVTVYLKEYVPGSTVRTCPSEDLPNAARLHASLHRSGVVVLDPIQHNYIRKADGAWYFIDFDGAKLTRYLSPRFLYLASREFHRLYRWLCGGDRALYDEFLSAYYAHAPGYTRRHKQLFNMLWHRWDARAAHYFTPRSRSGVSKGSG